MLRILNSGVESYPCRLNLLNTGDRHCLRQLYSIVSYHIGPKEDSHLVEWQPVHAFSLSEALFLQKLISENSILQSFSEKIPLLLSFFFSVHKEVLYTASIFSRNSELSKPKYE